MGKEDSKKDLYLAILVVVPFLLRSLLDFFFRSAREYVLKLCCGGNPLKEALIPSMKHHVAESTNKAGRSVLVLIIDENDPVDVKELKRKINADICDKGDSRLYTINEPADLCSPSGLMDYENMSWEYIRLCMGWTPQMAITVGAMRLLLWHWLQPVMYFWVLYTFSSDISKLQLGFGLAVAARESIYCIAVLLSLFKCPFFLLVNMSAGWRKQGANLSTRIVCLLSFVCCPEKGVLVLLLTKGPQQQHSDWFWLYLFFVLLIPLLDLCGMAALIIGLVRNEMPYPLAIGYGVTAVAGVVGLGIFASLFCFDCYIRNKKAAFRGRSFI